METVNLPALPTSWFDVRAIRYFVSASTFEKTNLRSFYYFVFRDRVSLFSFSPGSPGMCSVDQAEMLGHPFSFCRPRLSNRLFCKAGNL